MENYLHHISQFLIAHPNWGYFIAFIVAFAESLPIVGTVVPGSISMTAVGTLIGSGALPGVSTVICGILGAFVGDTFSFVIGRKYENSLFKIWPFSRYHKLLDKGERFFNKHGGKSVIIGRFIGPIRSSVPLIAGLLKMRTWPFLFAAFPSAVFWAILYFLPGIMVGALAMELPTSEATMFVIYGIGIVVLLWLVFWLIQRMFGWVCTKVSKLTSHWWSILKEQDAFLYRLLCSKQHASDHHQLSLYLGSKILGILFLLVAIGVFSHSWLIQLNRPLFYLLQSIHTTGLTHFFAAMTCLGTPMYISLIGLVSALYFWLSGNRRDAVAMLLITLSVFVLVGGIKTVLHWPRPTGLMYVKSSSSFPSGHTTLSFAILGMLAYLFAQAMPAKKRWMSYFTLYLLVFLIALSRLYLGAHWLTDIVGSVLLASCLLCSVILWHRRHPQSQKPKLYHCLIICLFILLTWTYSVKTQYIATVKGSEPKHVVKLVSRQDWWQHPLNYTPRHQLTLTGAKGMLFNLQWAGQLPKIHKLLLQQGWQPSLKHTWKYNILRLADANPIYHLPIIHRLYDHRKPVLVLIKHLDHDHAIAELRLWLANIYFTDDNDSLYIGTINYHLPAKHLLLHKKTQLLKWNKHNAIHILSSELNNMQKKVLLTSAGNRILVIKQ